MPDTETKLIHLICGSTGAGKTTYARTLAAHIGGVVFSIDEWMVSLFGDDAPDELNPSWIFPRVRRCEAQIWSTALALAKMGVPSILDFGFQRYDHRQKFVKLADQANLTVAMHSLNVDRAERWSRVQARNQNKGETFHMDITPEMFGYVERIWEPPKDSEILAASRIGLGRPL